ncbi:hypothetical protein [Streptomyces sp. NPDC052012]|uniref:hypothetical protein n=1 Tax=Streptomyces sp. NPDC052012 TaxID=3155051 RepID=UPI00344F17FE
MRTLVRTVPAIAAAADLTLVPAAPASADEAPSVSGVECRARQSSRQDNGGPSRGLLPSRAKLVIHGTTQICGPGSVEVNARQAYRPTVTGPTNEN